jgi:hypothetical protein
MAPEQIQLALAALSAQIVVTLFVRRLLNID